MKYLKNIIRKILVILNDQEKKSLWALTAFDLVISAFDIFFLVLLLCIINFFTLSGNSKLNGFPFFILFNKNPILLITLFFICFSIKNILGFYVFKMQNNFVYAVASRLSNDNLDKYFHNEYLNYVHIDSSVHIRKISQQPIEFAQYILRGLQQIINQAILIIITVVSILLYNGRLFLILFLILCPPIILVSYLMKQSLSNARSNSKKAAEKSIQYLYEALTGFIESNLYHKYTFFENRYSWKQSQLNKHLAQQQNIQGMPSRLMEIFAIFGFFLLIVIDSVYTNTIPIITIGAFMAAVYKIIPGIVKILNSIGQIKTYQFTIEDLIKINTVMNEKKRDQLMDNLQSIEFVNVSFNYDGVSVLDKFNMQIREGDFVGIVSVSGKGKTTLLNLLLGFLNPIDGYIRINAQLASRQQLQKCWNKIAYSKQQPFLINDTILNNIVLDDEIDHRRLAEATNISGLRDFVEQQIEGYNIKVEENGKNISGGQKQRIVLARAFYKNYDLLILDEPFKELDEESESKILHQLQVIASKGKIVILVTHNPNNLSFCNKIISLDDE